MTVTVIYIMIIISIETIITMLWQHAGSLLRSLFCPRPNIICGAPQVTGVLWTLAPLVIISISMSWTKRKRRRHGTMQCSSGEF